MKKSVFFCIIVSVAFAISSVKASNNEFIRLDLYPSYPNKISPDGRYIVGTHLGSGFLYDLETRQSLVLTGSQEATDVTSDQVVAGYYTSTFSFDHTTKTVTLAGIWENGSWTSPGIGNLTANDIDGASDGSQAFALSTDKKKLGGALVKVAQSFSHPCVWTKNEDNTWNYRIYSVPPNDFLPYRNAKIWALSGDGTLAGGWTTNNSGDRVATFWKSPTEYILASGASINDGVRFISENGKYATLVCNNRATLYDVEENRFETIPAHSGAAASKITGVADDGTVIGYSEFGSAVGGWRLGYVYSKSLGFFDFADYVETFAPEVDLGDINFREHAFTVPKDISADGTVITGWYGTNDLDMATWVLKLAVKPHILNEPQNFRMNVMDHRSVILSWDAPESMTDYTLTGYALYRNSVLIETIPSGTRTYTDENPDSGTHAYAIAALYGDEFSPKTDALYAEIYSTELPFFENFESGDFSTHFWKVDPTQPASWLLIIGSDLINPRGLAGKGATFFSPTQSGSYSLVSKDMDARNAETVYLKFALKYTIHNPAASKEKLHVEVCAGADWKTVKSYDASGIVSGKTYGWTVETINLSSEVSGKEFQIRFRAQGENTEVNTWDLDNVRIDIRPVSDELPVPAKPEGRVSENLGVELNWKNPAGARELTYFNGVCNTATGNEGKRFIAANAFNAATITPYLGCYLSSVTVQINQISETDHLLGLVVFYGDTRIDQDLPAYVPNTWNTFALETPLLLDEAKELKFGVDVIEHHSQEMVIGNDDSGSIDANGNVYSENNGTTWHKLADVEVFNNWAIIGNLTYAAEPAEARDGSFLGYILHRNGQALDRLIYQSKYTDTEIDPTTKPVYALSAYHDNGLESELSELFELIPIGIPENPEAAMFRIFPNPSSDHIRISGSFTRAVLMNASGKVVLETGQNPVSLASFPPGVYLLRIESGMQVTTVPVLKTQ